MFAVRGFSFRKAPARQRGIKKNQFLWCEEFRRGRRSRTNLAFVSHFLRQVRRRTFTREIPVPSPESVLTWMIPYYVVPSVFAYSDLIPNETTESWITVGAECLSTLEERQIKRVKIWDRSSSSTNKICVVWALCDLHHGVKETISHTSWWPALKGSRLFFIDKLQTELYCAVTSKKKKRKRKLSWKRKLIRNESQFVHLLSAKIIRGQNQHISSSSTHTCSTNSSPWGVYYVFIAFIDSSRV